MTGVVLPPLPNPATPPIEPLEGCCPQPFAKDTSHVCDTLVKAVMATLASLGWTDFFADQLEADEANLVPTRIASVHRDR